MFTRRRKLVSFLVLLVAPALVWAQQLTVSAAASLTEAFREIGQRFEAATPGVTVRFNFAASGVLIQQIRQGAPVDVFVSADQETMTRGIEDKLLDPSTPRDFAGNSVVLITPVQGGPSIKSVQDLTRADVKRIAVGKVATVPVGRYTKQVLDAAKLWDTLEPKFVQADSVRQVLDYVARGEAEAGFVYRTDAAVMKDRVQIVLTAEGHSPVTYPAAVVADSRSRDRALAFVAFLASPAARDILSRFGFVLPN